MTFTETVSPSTAAVTLDAAAKTFTLLSNDFNDAQSGVLVSLDVTFEDDPAATFTESFSVNLVDQCFETTLIGEPMPDIIAIVGAPVLEVEYPVFEDSLSVSLGSSVCRPVITTFAATDPANTDFGYEHELPNLLITSQPPHEPATIEMRRTSFLENYPVVKSVELFKVDYLKLEPYSLDNITYNIT